jgi:alkanesulfonate monooxygenase SsuD/methylene tetrahydromethanopterin reductase-like flavin-dependent oxidoreductase (luciferase family)
VLLPHFGEHASASGIVREAQRAESLGFDSVWIRDHIIYRPHHWESPDPAFYEPLVTLGALAVATERIVLGTASLIPHRHPVYLAQQLATLSQFTGPGRFIAGFGTGGYRHELELVGLGEAKGGAVHREQVEIMRRIWSGDSISHQGQQYQFEDVEIHPSPAGPIPIFYCGGSRVSVRRAVEYCDGWLPGQLSTAAPTYEHRMGLLRQLAAEQGKPPPVAGAIPFVSPARSREEGLAKLNLEALLAAANASRILVRPPSGRFETADDLEGALLVGPPQLIVEQARQLQALGCDYLVFDLRYRFADWESCLHTLAEEVVPELRR